MSLYTYIVDPISYHKYHYNSVEYKNILRKYIRQVYKTGGGGNSKSKFNALKFIQNMRRKNDKRIKKAFRARIKRIRKAKSITTAKKK